MNHPESKAGLLFRHWVRANSKRLVSGSYEMKDSRGKDSIPFSEIKEEQIAHAIANKSDKGNLTRIMGGTTGAADYHFLRNAAAFVVIRYPHTMEIIDIHTLMLERERNKRKSLTSARAAEISVISVKLKKTA